MPRSTPLPPSLPELNSVQTFGIYGFREQRSILIAALAFQGIADEIIKDRANQSLPDQWMF